MSRWSRQQDEYLWEHGNEGAERVAEGMRREFGVIRTPGAVKRHAYRIGAPIIQHETCPQCGGRHDHLQPSGVCYQCNQRNLAAAQRSRNDALRRELRANKSKAERRKAEREYDAARAEAYRLRRKLCATA